MDLAALRARAIELDSQRIEALSFLQLDPTNAQFIALMQMIDNAIAVNNSEISRHSTQKSTTVVEAPAQVQAIPAASVASASTAKKIAEASDESDEDDSGARGDLRPGDTVSVAGSGGRVFAGTLLEIRKPSNSSGSESECVVKYFEYADQAVVPMSSLSPLPPGFYTRPDVYAGLKCLCKYATDMQYYEVEVQSLTSYGVLVRYTKYGNSEEVPVEYLRPKSAAAAAEAEAEREQASKRTLIDIPEALRILPTDTEEEKARKRKKIKGLKSHNRIVTKERELEGSKASWQSFVSKATKKPNSLLNKASFQSK